MKYINSILKTIAQAIVIATAVLSGYAIFFPQGKVNLTQESIKKIDSLVKATKTQTDSIYHSGKDSLK